MTRRRKTMGGARAALGLGAVLSLGALCTAPSFAQDQDQELKRSETGDEQKLETVLVTGSRIRRAGFDTLEPAGVVTAEYIESRGLTNIADALNESPGFGTAVTPEGGQSTFGVGLNFVNRFGLGTNRTLTLINGRRFVSSNPASIFSPAAPGSQVDLNWVPTILVDQIENLAVGGAPTYGADAIAGVVNVKLKRNFEGLRFFGQYGQLESGEGQGNSIGAVFGTPFAAGRGNVTASIQRSQVDGILATDIRRFADAYSFAVNPTAAQAAAQPGRTPANDGRVNTSIPFNTNSSDGIPNAVLIRNRRIFTLTFGGLALPTGANNLADGRLRCFGATATTPGTCLQFAPNGNLVPYNPGVNFGTIDASGGDGLYLVETLQVGTESERLSGTLSARYDLSDNVEAFFDAFGYKAEATEIVDQTPYNATLFAGASSAITFPANHPTLTAQAQQTLASLGATAFRISRAHRDLAENSANGKNDLFQLVAGLTGKFEALNRTFNWETYANYGKNDLVYFSQQVNRQRFVNALNVVSVGGQLQCSPNPGYTGLPAAQGGRVFVGADAPVADPNCVPLDIFGEGRPSAAARAYISSLQRADAEIEQRVFNANIGSSLLDVWGGPVAFNVGFEYRREAGDFAPDSYLAQGLGRSAAITPNRGAYSTKEVFGELLVPLVAATNELPFVHRLTLTGKARRVDNTVNGEFTAWTGGLQWAPIEDIEFRGNVTRSLRAPALTELFTPVAPIFTTVPDPCDARNVTGGTRPENRARNCAQFYRDFGITPPWQSTAVSATTQGSLQGDTGLRNEAANAWTVGFVARPRFLPGLELALDWVDIRIDDIVTNLSATDLVTACFDNDNYPNEYCARFTRNPASTADPLQRGQITFARTGYANGDFQSMAGVTLEARYKKNLADWGLENSGTIEIGASYYRLREELRSATGIVTVNSEEVIGSPTDSAQLNLVYSRGPFAARWQTNYQGAQLYSRTFTVETRDILEVEDIWTHNLSFAYDLFDRAVVRLAVTNLFDEPAPFPIAGDAFGGNYDFLGRRYSLSVTYKLDRGN